MDQLAETEHPTHALKHAITEAKALAREQIDHILEERFSEITNQLSTGFDRAVDVRARALSDKAAAMARGSAQRELTDELNQTARRLEKAESRDVWIRTLLQATDGFCARAALFAVQGKDLRYEGGRDVGEGEEFFEKAIPLQDAAAFQNAVESRDTVIAIGTPGELSAAVAKFLGDTSGKKVYLFPLLVRQKVVGVLYAEPGERPDVEPVDVSALELLSMLAANSIEAAEEVTVQSKGVESRELITISGIQEPRKGFEPVIPRNEDHAHLRARRLARTQVAQMLLYQAQRVRQGRSAGDLYGALKQEIDAGRNAFRQQFLSDCPSMADYYHEELVERLANRNAALLGSGYPGPLV